MKVAIADVNVEGLAETAKQAAAIVGQANVLVVPTDVGKFDSVVQFREKVYEAWGEVGVLCRCVSPDFVLLSSRSRIIAVVSADLTVCGLLGVLARRSSTPIVARDGSIATPFLLHLALFQV